VPISEETKAAIIRDGEEGRLTLEEIAAKHLGNKNKLGTVSKILKKANVKLKRSRGDRRKDTFSPKLSDKKTIPQAPLILESFDPEKRLELIDSALSQLKAILPKTNYSKGMNEWTASLERLFNQRREEERATPPAAESDGFFEALETKTPEIWKDVDAQANPIQVAALQLETVATDDMVDQEKPDP
jgi:hypothetical protein